MSFRGLRFSLFQFSGLGLRSLENDHRREGVLAGFTEINPSHLMARTPDVQTARRHLIHKSKNTKPRELENRDISMMNVGV